LKSSHLLSSALACGAGALTVFAFAPFGFPLLAIVTLAALFQLWQHAGSARAAARLGYFFGLGLFGAGASWVYVALQAFGDMPAFVAVLSTAGFVAYLALWPALAGAVAVRFTRVNSAPRALALVAAWTLGEWLRGTVMSGFPWLAIGNAQLPGSSLAGFAPLGGVLAVTLAAALVAALLAWAIEAVAHSTPRVPVLCAAAAALLFIAGHFVGRIPWTAPVGEPLDVSLIQGNVAQRDKFDPEYRDRNFRLYAHLAEISRGRLIVFPESALPVFVDDVPDEVIARISAAARARDGDALIGVFTLEAPPPGEEEALIHNSVVSVGSSDPQIYRKHHLVPFGETIPLKSVVGWFIHSVLSIPLADQAAGPANTPPLAVAGQQVAVNICYEDAFGEELRHAARTATLLINVTNDAWYGRSIAAWQHDQIAAMRALEMGRPLLRATNTGVTAAIGPDGRETARLPWYTRGILEVSVTGRSGETPYVRVGDLGPVLLCVALLLVAFGADRARQRFA
jgi:apolipoprotein N-acyltransferase